MTNAEIIRKADLTVTDLTDDGGLLNAEQANRFVRKLIKVPTLLQSVRQVPMNAPTRNINKVLFNKRIMRPATSGTALAQAAIDSATTFDPLAEDNNRAKVLTEQIVLNTVEYISEVHVPYDVIEDNVERGDVGQRDDNSGANAGGGFIDTLLSLMAERAALDLEELAISGDDDVVAVDPYLGSQDGYLKRVTEFGQQQDHSGATIDKTRFKLMLRAMPDQYLRNMAALRHYVSFNQETEYRDQLADRGTALGDQSVNGRAPVTPFGVPVESVSLMPDDEMLFTNPQNLIWGIQRSIMLEADKDISSRVLKFVITTRVAMQVEEAEAAVIGINLGLS